MGTLKYSQLPAATLLTGPELISYNQSGTVRDDISTLGIFLAPTALIALPPVLNLVANMASTGSSLTFTADQVILATSLSGSLHRASSISQISNLSTTGAGGVDTGTLTNFAAVYLIYNPTTATTSTLATAATSAVASEIYAGANMPAGYTYSRLISVRQLSGANTYQIGYQQDNSVWVPDTTFGDAGVHTWTLNDISTSVPKNAKTFSGIIATWANPTETGTPSWQVAAADNIGVRTYGMLMSGGQTLPAYTVHQVPMQTVQRSDTQIPGAVNFIAGTGYIITSYTF